MLFQSYIEGRELNVSILGNSKMPWVLPPTEIKFTGYKENHIDEILSYRSKWEEDSFEYKGVSSLNIFDDSDNPLLEILKENAVRCWHEFGLNGYARIDFRIDHEGKAWVLEINANPCITPEESSFLRAAAQEGLSYTDVVKQIISAV